LKAGLWDQSSAIASLFTNNVSTKHFLQVGCLGLIRAYNRVVPEHSPAGLRDWRTPRNNKRLLEAMELDRLEVKTLSTRPEFPPVVNALSTGGILPTD